MTEISAAASKPLWPLVQRTTRQALNCGALQPIATQIHTIDDDGIPFLVRMVDSLARKEKVRQQPRDCSQQKPDNPFLPYDEDLYIADVSPTHVCLLNKFNVVDHHLLIITREYVSQQEWLILEDFVALACCLQEIAGLGFYNSGPISGASQHHKHLQLIPFTENKNAVTLPIAKAVDAEQTAIADLQYLPNLPYQHRLQLLPPVWGQDCQTLGTTLLHTYRQLVSELGLDLTAPQPDQSYNLLVTRDWMMVVRRSQPDYKGINVNSLGYAGWLLVKTPAELEKLRQIGPLNLLTQVGLPRN